ncbi:MAG: TetR/AcrR family transcriptional regulator [Anaerolineaceae bacterium]|nr:TetR/AcrR family transcriptional regulator [Anaerolineaceae bacterium]
MNTFERILDTALELFNRSGSEAVSTNHIAEAMGISPGNLYYHVHNKDEIIRAIFERLFTAWDTRLSLPEGVVPTVDDLAGLVRVNFEILWQFRFVYRELNALIQHDPQLKSRFIQVRQRGFAGFRQLFDGFAQAGILRPGPDPQEVQRLAEMCWMISEFWLPTLEISGQEINPAHLQHGVELMLFLLQPYRVDG